MQLWIGERVESGALSRHRALSVGTAAESFQPSWNSLRRHDTPQWLEDAKFGIYCHWGLQTVWRQPEHAGLSYRQAIPFFKAEKFDPAAWAELFAAAGADFAGPVTWHGSGYVHWASKLTPWNSLDLPPHRDILGELARAVRARGMRVIASFHQGYHYSFPHWGGDPEYTNPEYTGIYGPVHDLGLKVPTGKRATYEEQERTSEELQRHMVETMLEAVDRYEPDIVWLDTSFGGTTRPFNQKRVVAGRWQPEADIYLGGFNERWQRKFLSGVFNMGARSGREVEFVYKTLDVPPGIGMRNIENGLLDELTYDPWMTDIDMLYDPAGKHHWFHQEGVPIKSANYLVDLLVDVVSKNGRLLLNVPPRADGSFTPEIEEQLRAFGRWLQVNGEAIKGASPWFCFGEGPTRVKTGHYSDTTGENHFGAADIRYTAKGDALYAIFLAWPGERAVLQLLGSRGRVFEGEIRDVTLLGGDAKPLKWEQFPDRLEVTMPSASVGEFAHTLRIRLK